MRADLPGRHRAAAHGAGQGEPASDRAAARIDHRIVGRRDHQQVARRRHSELERRRRAALRLHGGAGGGPPHLARHPARPHRRGRPDHRQPEGRTTDRALRNRARAVRRPAHPGLAHDLADQGRRGQCRRRVEDRARRHPAAPGRAARAAAVGGSGRGERQVPGLLRAGRAVCRDHGRGRHDPRGEPAVLGSAAATPGSRSSGSRSGKGRGGRPRRISWHRSRRRRLRRPTGQTFRAEMPYFVADGSERMADVTIQPIRDDAGRVLFLAPDRHRHHRSQAGRGRAREVRHARSKTAPTSSACAT